MTGTVLLIIRTALAATLYIFLGWALLTLWRDIRRQQKNSVAIKKPPEIKLAIRIGDDLEAIHEKVYQGTEVTLGRDPTCECILSSEAVSARHARFSFHHGQWWLEDLKSTNGTFLNGEAVITSVVTTVGDKIQIGNIFITVVEVKENR